jgi:nicotinate phosphoribosyltransferase
MRQSALCLDLYELTMAQSFLDEGIGASATFSLFVRRLPRQRSYLVAAGLDDVLDFLGSFAFAPTELAYLESTGLFTSRLLDHLATLRFRGSVRALPEGTVCFADEPILEVTAPIVEAQLVETAVINLIQLQTLVASKAARAATVAQGRRLVDFSYRRTQGLESGVQVARASYLSGFSATSNVLAGQRYGIPVAGTMAHSYVEAFPSEVAAFRAYTRAYPDRAVLLIDTYDTLEGARRAAIVGQELALRGHQLAGVRLDSGDLIGLSRAVRAILDEAGLSDTIVFASGGLDEAFVAEALEAGAPIDGFGLGTQLGVSADAPTLDIVYKLVSYDGRPTLKSSADKSTWPGAKQVWRAHDGGRLVGDWLALADEPAPTAAQPLMVDVMEDGRRLAAPEPLDAIRSRCGEHVAALPPELRQLAHAAPYPVRPTEALRALQREVAARVGAATEVPT